ncbi:MAG: GtrA family protein [Sphingobacteriales bacterium]|nr:MAG: GtrA family protein [Sphingobacteriales bacterium]
MRQVHHTVRATILRFIDLFYPPFRRLMNIQMFRYAACGGGNTAFNILIYFLTYHYVLHEQVVDFGFWAFEPHSAAVFLAFCCTFPIGFYLSMFVVFQGSYLKRRVQLWRYFLVTMACLFLNWLFVKIFVEVMHFYPTPSYITTVGIVVLFSYLAQRFFTFKGNRALD